MKRFFFIVASLCAPLIASAHEVYVLGRNVIAIDTMAPSPNPFGAIAGNEMQFLFWGFIAVLTVSTVFAASIFHTFEKRFDPTLRRLKKYAPLSARLTLGVCLIACAFYQGLFGPELPFAQFAGAYAPVLTGLFYALGTLVLVGYYTRVAALVAVAVFGLAVAHYGIYMLTYTNYLGEMLVLAILGGYSHGLHTRAHDIGRHYFARLSRRMEPYAFLIARVAFGVAVMFAAFYAKFLHSDLALDTIRDYHLTNYFHFDPLFIVLGAFIIESLIGLFFILGIEVRWTALFFLFWLFLSLIYFGEAVWPHLVLVGLNITMFLHGYDRYTLEGYFFGKRGREPVL
ncbi:MAG: hypothetical protein V4474_03850 [Patescibacteria group bacterium]